MKKTVRTRKPTHEEIARVAYFFYEERGCEPGHEVEDWLRAEAHVCTDQKHTRTEREHRSPGEPSNASRGEATYGKAGQKAGRPD
jgi:hypothetical protein